jgi:hypothetical protein
MGIKAHKNKVKAEDKQGVRVKVKINVSVRVESRRVEDNAAPYPC